MLVKVMKLKDFIGKVVISTSTNRRFILHKVTSPITKVLLEQPNENGDHACYCFENINGDPISNGKLVFEDASLNELFIKAFEEYSHSVEAYYEDYGYYMN